MEYQAWKHQIRESSISHELITPLRCLIKLSQDLVSDADLKGSNKQLCKTIFNQAKIINAQINDTLDTNLHNKKQIMPNLTSVDLVKVTMETISVLDDEAEHHKL